MANEKDVRCFVSVHANASANPKAEGAWIIHAKGSTDGQALARAIFHRFLEVPDLPDQDPEKEVYADATPWVGNRSLSVLRRTRMPAVIVECGFLTSKDDLGELTDPLFQVDVALAIARGVDDWIQEMEAQE